jgi:asparagine synthase (glutamine-hydrolysing)
MPGLHLLGSTDGQPVSSDNKKRFMETLMGMRHFQWYETGVLHDGQDLIIGRSFYRGYPFTLFQDDWHLTIVEGALYNKSEKKIGEELAAISLTESNFDMLVKKIRTFLLSSNGEFLVVKCDKRSGKCLIVNDALGRLPFYYCSIPQSSSTLIVMSREIKFIIPYLQESDFDKTALGEYLLFGYSLGERTLWKNIKRLLPGSLLMIGTESEKLLRKEVLSWNLDPKNESREDHTTSRLETQELVDLFLSSLSDIAQAFPNEYAQIVSLSGGLDSRATLAGLIEVGVTPVAYSFPSAENRVAKKVADKLKVNYHIICSPFKISDEECVKLTDGLIDIGLRPRFSYLYGLRQAAGKAILYTGDGGDKTLSGLGFRFEIADVEGLLSYIIETDRIFGLDEISSILELNKDAFTRHLENHIASYPEKTMEGKFVHFKIFERGFKWLFNGEDRNRLFLWSTTPFYNFRFFKASMEESQRKKEYYRLYKGFLSSLNPALSRIEYHDRLVPLSTPNSLLKLFLFTFDWLKTHFYRDETLNLIDYFLGQRIHQMSNETKDSILRILKGRTLNSFNPLRTIEIVTREKNQSKLNILATLILYLSLVTPHQNS